MSDLGDLKPGDRVLVRRQPLLGRKSCLPIGLVLILAMLGADAGAAETSLCPKPLAMTSDGCQPAGHRPAPLPLRPSPPQQSTGREIEPQKRGFVLADGVLCPEIAILSAYLGGQQEEGQYRALQSVVGLFARPQFGCWRTLSKTPVEIVGSVDPRTLVKVRQSGEILYALPKDIEEGE